MRDWVHEVLLDRTTTNRGYFATSAVRELLARDEAKGWILQGNLFASYSRALAADVPGDTSKSSYTRGRELLAAMPQGLSILVNCDTHTPDI